MLQGRNGPSLGEGVGMGESWYVATSWEEGDKEQEAPSDG